MPERQLHIVAFDIPYPPNYGGVIDVWYKLKALHAKGIKIILHCFLLTLTNLKRLMILMVMMT